jgi:hypothetical protein
MPVNSSGLSGALASNFASPAADAAGCAKQWADAMRDYASGVVPPSLNVKTAAAALESGLSSAFAAPSAIAGMEQAFAAFAASLALGMAPTFTGVPPPGPVGFAAQFGGPAPETHGAAAGAIAGRIDAWFKTGTATLMAPPNTISNWT